MRTVWKYPLNAAAYNLIPMPAGAQVLTVQMQGDVITLWAMVDSQAALVKRDFYLVGTGHVIPEDATDYIGSIQVAGGAFILHLFEGVRL